MTTQTMTVRLLQLVKIKTEEYRRFKTLEGLTGVPGDTWKSWFHGRQRPTAEMIEAICKVWPEYAFWLVTGIDDYEHGHTQPEKPELRERSAARDYFLARLELMDWVATNEFTKDDQQRYFEAREGKGSIDAEVAAKIEGWIDLIVKVDQLAEIRNAQETSLERFERDQENKKGMPI
jgi:predicted MPP superfamily phosphohydrolase